jgi:hypothetical protein
MFNFLKVTLLSLILFSTCANAVVVPGSVAATPSTYDVVVTRIDFVRTDGTVVNFFTGNRALNIAQVVPGSVCGFIGAGTVLPSGNYNQMRITISGNFVMSASVADAGGGQPCRTTSAGGSTVVGGITVSTGSTDGGAAQLETIAIPTGVGVTMPTGLTALGGNLYQFAQAVSISIPENAQVLPQIRVSFDVSSAIEFLTTGVGSCMVTPVPPVITAAVG